MAEHELSLSGLPQACKNAVGALLRQDETAQMLKQWLELASRQLVALGFTLGAGAPLFSGGKDHFGQNLSCSQLLKDSVSGRPMPLRVNLYVPTDPVYFGRFDASVTLNCLASRGPSGRSSAHTLVAMPLFTCEPQPELVRFGGLTERLRSHLLQTIGAAFPTGLEMTMMEFAVRVDETLSH